MPEEVLFETEGSMDRSEIASYLRTVADRLDAGDEIGLEAGDQHVTLAPPARPTFEVKAERETDGGPDELSVEFEIEWDEGESGTDGDGRLSIE
jgi:amphi-Trp domain-containing protein